MTDPDERPTLTDELFGMESQPSAVPSRGLSWPRFLGEPPGWRERMLGGLGFITYTLVNLVVMWVPLHGGDANTVAQALVLVLLAFGLGSLLAWLVGGYWRPFGFGMIGGWLTLTLFSLGYATGLS